MVMGGLSPRVRGNPAAEDATRRTPRSIPACAGEPSRMALRQHARRVYPRVCGGTSSPTSLIACSTGLSPRVRGNLPPRRRTPTPTAVYPRVCGGTIRAPGGGLGRYGLSPRVRGNQIVGPFRIIRIGSIPACAGEPPSQSRECSLPQVYPRVCGGTVRGEIIATAAGGLSPRVRGNLIPTGDVPGVVGSIPACAGEPLVVCCRPVLNEVYPRVCGGTLTGVPIGTALVGLSPRVRGNPPLWFRPSGPWGSIPACAGEPRTRQRSGHICPVYPRVCGGTTARSMDTTT